MKRLICLFTGHRWQKHPLVAMECCSRCRECRDWYTQTSASGYVRSRNL